MVPVRRAAIELNRALKAVNPPTNDRQQNGFPGGCGWSGMVEGDIRNKS